MVEMSLDKRQLCDIQGRLFELALYNEYDCPAFIKAFMNSETAPHWTTPMTASSGRARNIFSKS